MKRWAGMAAAIAIVVVWATTRDRRDDASPSAEVATPPGLAVMVNSDLDFGRVPPGRHGVRLRLKNWSAAAARVVGVDSTCGCAMPQLDELPTIPPGLISGRADRGDVGSRDRCGTEPRKNSIQLLDVESGRRCDLDPDGAAVRGDVDDQLVARLYRPLRTITVA